MVKRLLIDASHAEETRMVVLDGNRIEDFDVEVASRRQIRGNIYLAKVVRVEPSLQAAFVDYGGNRHGFLAFSEIHPDYYQIPVADREKLLALQAEAMRDAREEEAFEEDEIEGGARAERAREATETPAFPPAEAAAMDDSAAVSESPPLLLPRPERPEGEESADGTGDGPAQEQSFASEGAEEAYAAPAPEMLGGEEDGSDADLIDETRRHQIPLKFLRQYKIQEVIHRRQIMLVQVVKEERGNKGAALTTYISLPGRYCVLMPNALRGGGISRKITSPADRRRLREVIREIGIPEGMALIVRTAGANRPKEDIRRDCEYLLRLWDEIRETTLRSIAPALIYEDASLIKRAIRDIYMRDIDEVIVDGESGFREAREMMRLMTPAHVNKVTLWRDGGMPLFARYQIEQQLEAVFRPVVPLRSGGYIVINQTEALVAIDVNSGRATRERNVEDTALRTNLEAAEEIARQIRLRDLGGLIVIDFIDMDQRRHNIQVERRLKEALKQDRARIQIGSISPFGLLEMSRQRLRPSLVETSLVPCPHCGGLGHVRSTESAAVHVLRLLEEEAARRRAAELAVHAAAPVVLYIFNTKRSFLNEIEARFGVRVTFEIDPALIGEQVRIERKRGVPSPEARPEPVTPTQIAEAMSAGPESAAAPEIPAAAEPVRSGEGGSEIPAAETEKRRKRRRRRRPQRREEGLQAAPAAPSDGEAAAVAPSVMPPAPEPFVAEEEVSLFVAAEMEVREEVSERPGKEAGKEAASLPASPAEESAQVPAVEAEGASFAAAEVSLSAPLASEDETPGTEEGERKPRTRRRRATTPRATSRRPRRKAEPPAAGDGQAPPAPASEEAPPERAAEPAVAGADTSPAPFPQGEGMTLSRKVDEGAPVSTATGAEAATADHPPAGNGAHGGGTAEGTALWQTGEASLGETAPAEAGERGPQASVPITPIVVGVTPVPERKRGWWRRG